VNSFQTQTGQGQNASRASTETTRYLSAAGYLNKEFRNYVLENIVHEKFGSDP
jgi:hypothetical protein